MQKIVSDDIALCSGLSPMANVLICLPLLLQMLYVHKNMPQTQMHQTCCDLVAEEVHGIPPLVNNNVSEDLESSTPCIYSNFF